MSSENKNIMLSVSELNAYYGSLKALQGINIEFFTGECVGIFGHNGCGKSTLLNCLIGAVEETEGSIKFNDTKIIPGSIPRNILLGIGMVPQVNNVFPNLSVEQCLKIAGIQRQSASLQEVYEIFPILKDRRVQYAGSMSGGEQQILAVAMSLMTKPKVMLLDEPTAGLSPIAAENVLGSLKDINQNFGTTIIIVEQNVLLALKIVQRGIILRAGQVVFDNDSSILKDASNLWEYF
jgi:branched-chain amino acid transport system ATP-binding protein